MDVNELRFTDRRCREMADLVGSWKRPLLLSHERADGDSIGSLLALRSMLRELGTQPTALLFEPPHQRYTWMLADDPIGVFSADDDPALGESDGIIILDTCAYGQLQPVEDWLRTAELPKLAVDHHVTRDAVADHYLVDEKASATCLMLYEWCRAVGWPTDDPARTALYVGMATDTGWFRFSNTDARTLQAATALVQAGVQPAYVFERIYQSESPARFRLLGSVLGRTQLHHAQRLAVMPLTADMFTETGATPADTEDLVNYPLQMRTVEVSVLLIDQGNGTIRTSFRSKPPTARRPDIDVAAIASSLGGGGHRRAAAARVPGQMDEVMHTVVERVGAVLP